MHFTYFPFSTNDLEKEMDEIEWATLWETDPEQMITQVRFAADLDKQKQQQASSSPKSDKTSEKPASENTGEDAKKSHMDDLRETIMRERDIPLLMKPPGPPAND